MLGNYTKGMNIKIPARFQTNDGKPVMVENVVLRIEHFDNDEKAVVHDLPESPMQQLSLSDYVYNYTVPQASKDGTYLVHISAKVPQNGNRVFEALEQFNVITSQLKPIGDRHYTPLQPNVGVEKPKINTVEDIESSKPIIKNNNDLYNSLSHGEKIVEDLVVDVENNPVKGVHINIFVKKDFIPNDPQNLKVASAMTDQFGKWSVKLPEGEYVFVYKSIGHKETREFRKV